MKQPILLLYLQTSHRKKMINQNFVSAWTAEAGNETTISIKLIILKRIFIDVDARIQSHIDPKGDKCNTNI